MKIVPTMDRARVVRMMLTKDEEGNFVYGQRYISKETGISRPYIKKLAKQIGHKFPRNGIEIKGLLCMCRNCGSLFRRPKSKVYRARNNFCEEECRLAFMKGPNHPSWKTGKTAATFSKWIVNQKDFLTWKQRALERAGYKCEISGLETELDVHHIKPKAMYQELALDDNNALVVSKIAHHKIHQLITKGMEFEEAIEELRKEYNKIQEDKGDLVAE